MNHKTENIYRWITIGLFAVALSAAAPRITLAQGNGGGSQQPHTHPVEGPEPAWFLLFAAGGAVPLGAYLRKRRVEKAAKG